MPYTDTSDVLFDPEFAELIIVLRRQEAINSYGESVVTDKTLTTAAVVTSGSSDALNRLPEGQYEPHLITVHSPLRLVSASVNQQPDVVVWRQRHFAVTRTYDYSHFGAGFTAADCTSLDYLDSTA